ncbi:MAG: hypothetical protein JXA28_04005, partial [Bacteroidetes bacterium]|nr:hypothetical protein [Bacteroidota bacterium]
MRYNIHIQCGLLALLFLNPILASAQQSVQPETLPVPGQSMRFGRLDIRHGLSQGMVFCTFQDSRGFMWFGTKEGLNRFDGHDFIVYRKRPGDSTSLPDNYVLAVTEDGRGRLWLATAAEGLVRFDPAREQFTKIPLADGNASTTVNRVEDLEIDHTGRLWVSVQGMPLMSIDPALDDPAAIRRSMHRSGPVLSHSSKEVNRLRLDQLGRISFLHEDGLYILDASAQRWNLTVPWEPLFGHIPGAGPFVFSATQSDGTIWVASGVRGVTELRRVSADGRHMLDSMRISVSGSDLYIRDMVQGSDGALYLVSFEYFMRYDIRTGDRAFGRADKERMAGYSGKGNHLFVNRSGILWISTSGFGLNTFDPLTLAFNARSGSLHEALFGKELQAFDRSIRKRTGGAMRLVNAVYPLRMENGDVWCGTRDHGLLHHDARTGAVKHYGLNPYDPYSFLMIRSHQPFVDSRGRVWIGNRHGVSRLTESPAQWEHYWFDGEEPDLTANDNHVTCWHETADGSIWLGTMAT